MGHAEGAGMTGNDMAWAGYDGLTETAAAVRFSAERGIRVPVRFAAAAGRALHSAASRRGVTTSDYIRIASAEATESYPPPCAGPCA
jgi:hypothetical protein